MSRDEQHGSIDGHRLTLTNLDKVYYLQTGTTKGEVLDYADRTGLFGMPRIGCQSAGRRRVLPRTRAKFFEKTCPTMRQTGLPPQNPAQYRIKRYLLVRSGHADVSGATGSLELHIPQWRAMPADSDPGTITSDARHPDRMVFDLDPGAGRGLADCIEVAHLIRELLNGMGLAAYPLTSGSKGVHVYAPLDGSATCQQVSDVAKELARSLEADYPQLIVSKMKKKLRKNKVFIDWSQTPQPRPRLHHIHCWAASCQPRPEPGMSWQTLGLLNICTSKRSWNAWRILVICWSHWPNVPEHGCSLGDATPPRPRLKDRWPPTGYA